MGNRAKDPEHAQPKEDKVRKTLVAIGAVAGGLLALALVVLSAPELLVSRLEHEFASLILLPVVGGIALGWWSGAAFWITRLKRPVPLLWLVLSWGLVSGVAAVVIMWVPLSAWCYLADVRLTPVDHSPRSISKAMGLGLLASILLFPVGFIAGMIVAPFKQRRRD